MANLSFFLSSSSLDEKSSFSLFTNNGSRFVSHFTNVQDRKLFFTFVSLCLPTGRSVVCGFGNHRHWAGVASHELVLCRLVSPSHWVVVGFVCVSSP